jgi:hypothetical protein
MVDKDLKIVYIVHGDSNSVYGVFKSDVNAETLVNRLRAKYPKVLFWFTPYEFDDEFLEIM